MSKLKKVDPRTKLQANILDKAGGSKGVNPKKFESCVLDVKEKSGKKVNPWAVCASSLKKSLQKWPKMQKDDKPHPPGSPQDLAHKIIQEGDPKTVKQVDKLMDKSPDKAKEVIDHMKNSKHPDWEQSEHNRKLSAALKKCGMMKKSQNPPSRKLLRSHSIIAINNPKKPILDAFKPSVPKLNKADGMPSMPKVKPMAPPKAAGLGSVPKPKQSGLAKADPKVSDILTKLRTAKPEEIKQYVNHPNKSVAWTAKVYLRGGKNPDLFDVAASQVNKPIKGVKNG